MKGIDEVFIILIFCIVLIAIALIYAWSVIPGFSLSWCWMSAQSQTKEFGEWVLTGPFTAGKEKFEYEFTIRDCVERIKFRNKPESCEGSVAESQCPYGKKGYIITCRQRASWYQFWKETWWKRTPDICIGVDRPFAEEWGIDGPKKSGDSITKCVAVTLAEDKYHISEVPCKKESQIS